MKTLGQFQIYDAGEIIDPSRPSKILYVMLCALPMFAALLFGGVDIVVLGLFCVITAFIFVLWVMDAWSIGEFRFSANPLLLPIIGLILIGIVQLLPLGDPAVARYPGIARAPISLDHFRRGCSSPARIPYFLCRCVDVCRY